MEESFRAATIGAKQQKLYRTVTRPSLIVRNLPKGS